MAEAMDLGKDPNGPTHSSTLFVREDGSSMSFYVRPSPAKRRLSTLILHGGGTLCRVQEPGAVLLAQPGEAAAEASGDFISTRYVLDCVERNERLELEAYRLGPAAATKPGSRTEGAAAGQPAPQPDRGRIAFSYADDLAILTYVKDNARSSNSVTGNALWKAMEKSSLTQHSWQSLKDRYLKHLRGQEHKYLLGDAPVSPSSQKLKRKAEQDPEAADSGEPRNKRTPDLPEEAEAAEKFVTEEMQEKEETVKKILVEATREFEEIVVDESPDFEIHITMCDDDPPTPEEDSETQPDEEEEEEEEKVSPPEEEEMKTRASKEGRPNEDTGRRWSSAKERGLPRNQPYQHLGLGLPASRIVRKQFQLPKSPSSICGVYHGGPSKLQHPGIPGAESHCLSTRRSHSLPRGAVLLVIYLTKEYSRDKVEKYLTVCEVALVQLQI